MKAKITSWNVNGIRAVIRKNLWQTFLNSTDADVICLQETKAESDQVDPGFSQDYHAYWHSAQKKGYSGTAVLSKKKPLSVSKGLNDPLFDQEGRVITLEYEDFYLINVYTPNSQNQLRRLEYRTKTWDPAFRSYAQKLNKIKPVIICGDLNVAHKEIDIARPKANQRNPGFTDEERESFSKLLDSDFDDSFRVFCDQPDQYSWWSYRANARENNVGWRIDYICTSRHLRKQLVEASIHQNIFGSDHCPVSVTLKELSL